MKRSRSPQVTHSVHDSLDDDRNTAPQRLVEKGDGPGASVTVVHSPYGPQRGLYGWGHLFELPRRAIVPGYPNIHIGISSLNAVPGKSDRVMKTLLAQYRMKFNCLEHCYPYHKVSDADAWRVWADMVQDSNTDVAALPRGVASPVRFIYTIKANNLLTHVKQLAFDEELERHVDTFFRHRCPVLGPFLGPILLQLPPYFHWSKTNMDRLAALDARLPKDEVEVVVASAMKGEKEAGRAAPHGQATRSPSTRSRSRSSSREATQHVSVVRRRLIRIAVEFRHRSWYRDEVFQLLRELGWALVVAHHYNDPTFATHVDTGVPFMYARLHGALGEHVGDYGPSAMARWAAVVRRFVEEQTARGVSPEVFFFLNNNTSHVADTASSVVDATYLAERLTAMLPPAVREDSPSRTPATQPHTAARLGAADTPRVDGTTTAKPRRPRQKMTDRRGREIVSVDDTTSSSQETITVD